MSEILHNIMFPTTRFLGDESGASTVDFVVLAAAVIGVAIGVTNTMGGITIDHSNRIGDTFVNNGVKSYGDSAPIGD